MKLYLRLKAVPELAPLSPKQRRRVHELCLRRHVLFSPVTRRSLFAYLATLGCGALIGILGTDLLVRLGASKSFWFLITGTGGMMIGSFLFSRIAIPSLRPFYREVIEAEV